MRQRWISRLTLRYQTRRLICDLSSQADVMWLLADTARSRGEHELFVLANFNLWIHLFHRDFQFLYTDAVLERRKEKRNFLVRQLAICLFDFFDRIHSLAGTTLRPTIQSSSLPQDTKHTLDALLGGLGRLKDQHLHYLKKLRDRAAAHRDLDELQQYEVIEGVDVDKLLAIAQEVSDAQGALMAAWILATKSYVERSNFGIQPPAFGRG